MFTRRWFSSLLLICGGGLCIKLVEVARRGTLIADYVCEGLAGMGINLFSGWMVRWLCGLTALVWVHSLWQVFCQSIRSAASRFGIDFGWFLFLDGAGCRGFWICFSLNHYWIFSLGVRRSLSVVVYRVGRDTFFNPMDCRYIVCLRFWCCCNGTSFCKLSVVSQLQFDKA